MLPRIINFAYNRPRNQLNHAYNLILKGEDHFFTYGELAYT